MPHRFRLAETGKANFCFTLQIAEAWAVKLHVFNVDAADILMADFENQRFFLGKRAIAREGFMILRIDILRRCLAALAVQHHNTSFSALTKAARSSSVLISLDATRSKFSKSLHCGSRRDTGTPPRIFLSASASTTSSA